MRHGSILTQVIAAILLTLTSGCTATRSPAALKEIQDSKGFHTKSLYYTGSSFSFHYFEQEVFRTLPWAKPFSTDAYRVQRKELSLPADLFFSHSTYHGEKDPQRVKVRITDGPPYQVEPRTYSKRSWPETIKWLQDHTVVSKAGTP